MKRYIKASIGTDSIDLLKSIMDEDDSIAEYGVTTEYRTLYCIVSDYMVSDSGNDIDIEAALEDTLHRLIDNNMENHIYQIMGAYIPNDEDWEELDEYEDYITIDEGYILSGGITSFNVIDIPEYYEVTLIDNNDNTRTEIVKSDNIQKIYDYYNSDYDLHVAVEDIKKCSTDDLNYYKKHDVVPFEIID